MRDSAKAPANPAIDWFLILLSYGSLFTYGLIDNARGPVFPEILKAFTLTDSQGSIFFFLASLGALVVVVLAFYWLPKVGDVQALRFFTVCQIAGILLIGLSSSYEFVLVGAALFGASMGGLGLLGNLLTALAATPNVRRQALSGLHGMYGISSLIAPLGVTLIYSLGGTWQTVFLAFLVGPALVFLLSLKGRKGPARRADGTSSQVSIGPKPVRRSIWYAAMLSCYVVAEVLLGTRLVLFVRREQGYEVDEANLLLAGLFFALLVGRLAFALVRFPISNWVLLYISGAGGLIFFALGLMFSPLFLLGCGLSLSIFYPAAMALLADELGDHSGYAMSWCQSLQCLGLVIMHLVIGRLSDAYGLTSALWVGPGCLFIVMLCLVAGKNPLAPSTKPV